MSKSKRLEAYPTRYMELANHFASGVRMKAFVFDSQRKAIMCRFDLYGFRAALTANNMAREFPDFMSAKVLVSPKRPWTVTVLHVDDYIAEKP